MAVTTTKNKYLTISQVREHLNISLSSAYELSRRKDFPVCRIGNAIRVPESAFHAWIDMQTSIPMQLRAFMERSA